MSIVHNNAIIGSSGNQNTAYNISRSLRFRSSASAYLNRTPASAGSQTTWTWSGWVKRGSVSDSQNFLFGAVGTGGIASNSLRFSNADSSQKIFFENYNGAGADYYISTTAVYRDPSAWYHIVAVWDSTNATAANRQRLYVNGTQITASTTGNTIPQNATSSINSAIAHYIGGTTSYFDGYLAEVNFIDGQALTASSFGEFDSKTGVWKPKKYTGTYGTNGFYLNFNDNSAATAAAIGKDSSGNGNNWTPNNISVTAGATYDSMTDVPTLTSATAANYCVWNPLNYRTSYATTYADGNLKATFSSTVAYQTAYGTLAVSSGKYYWEVAVGALGTQTIIGVSQATYINDTSTLDKTYTNGGGISGGGSGASYTTNDIIGVALDVDGGTVTFYKNGTSQGSASLGTLPANGWTPYAYGYNGTVLNANFGQRPFSYTPPSGFKALNTYNLPDSTIVAGNKYMDATIWSGNNSSQNIVNAGSFKPDFVWIKNRSSGSNWNILFDSVRGATKSLYSNANSVEATAPSSGYLSSFNSNGFTVTASGTAADVNATGSNYIGWNWQGGQGSGVTNTTGTITSTVSANPSAGFSVVTYTGTGSAGTVGHGLGVAPALILNKSRDNTWDWVVYHKGLTSASYYLLLDQNAAQANDSTVWNGTAPTSSVFSIGGSGQSNAGTEKHVAYCWAEVAGFSKFGSYTGNGSSDGPFVYTGFRPKFVLTKRIDSTSDWWIQDTSRSNSNAANALLFPNLAQAEYTTAGVEMDILSNGFKLRNTNVTANGSGATIIYAAFAENPFKNSLAR